MKDSNVVKTVKGAVTLIGGIGVGAIITNAVKHVSPTSGMGSIMKLCVGVGTMLLGGLACDAASDYAEQKIDEAVEAIRITVTEEFEEDSTEVQEEKE